MAKFARFESKKVMRDPIHGYINLELVIFKEIIDTYEFQRLRRIHQLGGAHQVYHSAEHSRFSHSLGVYEIVRRMVSEVEDLRDNLSEYDKICVQLAALLHDIGHGPFSHAFEAISGCSHEEFTRKIILGNTQINKVLTKYDHKLPLDVANIIAHKHSNKLLSALISGQLDADRMDYLLRDSYFTGTSYGNFDLERVLRTLKLHDGQLVVKESGIHTIEDYIMSRYHMYWQVYYHPVSRCYENMIRLLFMRLKDLYMNNNLDVDKYKIFVPFINNKEISIEDYIKFDEASAYYGLSLLMDSEDQILKDLAKRVLKRDLFKVALYQSEEEKQKQMEEVIKNGYPIDYYFATDETTQVPYIPYGNNEPIYVLTHNNEVKELSMCSNIVNAIVKGEIKDDKRMYFPK